MHGALPQLAFGFGGYFNHSNHLYQCSVYFEKISTYFKKQADALGDMNGFVQENLTGFNRLYGREEISSEEFREKSLKICKKLVSRQALFQEL